MFVSKMKVSSVLSQAVLVLLFSAQLSSSTFARGPCPSVPSTPESGYFMFNTSAFDAPSYLGTWNNMLRNKDFSFSVGNCTQAYYYPGADGNLVVVNSEIVNGANSTSVGAARIDANVQGELFVRFSSAAPWANYLVAYTDYTQTGLVFSCFAVGFGHYKWAWIMSRDIANQIPAFYYDAIEDYGIPLSDMEVVIQSNCGAESSPYEQLIF